MGKGRRLRRTRSSEPAHVEHTTRAEKAQRIANRLAVLAAVIAVITLLIQIWALITLQSNLEAARYTEDEAAAVQALTPFGQIGVVLMLIGTAIFVVLTFRKRQKPALLGLLLTIAAGVLFILFAVRLGEAFAYSALRDRGLTTLDLIVRHYVTLLTPLILLIAALFSRRADKERFMAKVLIDASDDTPTIALGDDSADDDSI